MCKSCVDQNRNDDRHKTCDLKWRADVCRPMRRISCSLLLSWFNGTNQRISPSNVYLHQLMNSLMNSLLTQQDYKKTFHFLFGTFCGDFVQIWATFRLKFDRWLSWISDGWLRDMNFITSAGCVNIFCSLQLIFYI